MITLHMRQPLEHIMSMVSILCTSVSDDCFGPACSSQEEQRNTELHLLEAITKLLVELPKEPNPSTAYAASRILQLRSDVLQFIGCLTGSEAGKTALISHKNALPRLSRRISEEVDELYEWRRGQKLRYVLCPCATTAVSAGSFPFLIESQNTLHK
jgi:hypothetical protein